MIADKRSVFRPILESSKGLHLTIYLVNSKNVADLQSQIRRMLEECTEWLQPVQSSDEQKKFLEPVYALLTDSKILKRMKGNIAIYRNEGFFRVLNIPVPISASCQVATSFHIKPLLRWLQGDQDFLFLGVSSGAAQLYSGSQHKLKMLSSLKFSTLGEVISQENLIAEINSWLEKSLSPLKASKIRLFLAGDSNLMRPLAREIEYPFVVQTLVSQIFEKDEVTPICREIRSFLKIESHRQLEKALQEFRFAEQDNRAKKNIFQIAKAVVQGRVRKLIVTDEMNIFGKIDLHTGGLAIHPTDLDHEDDCILDDLAQLVLSQGGDVVVASRDDIPKGRPILAILDEDGRDLRLERDAFSQGLELRHG